jgi:hypothetical protein
MTEEEETYSLEFARGNSCQKAEKTSLYLQVSTPKPLAHEISIVSLNHNGKYPLQTYNIHRQNLLGSIQVLQ